MARPRRLARDRAFSKESTMPEEEAVLAAWRDGGSGEYVSDATERGVRAVVEAVLDAVYGVKP